jgi:hypothetical protein
LAVDELLTGLAGVDAKAAIQHLASASLDTSASAMGQSLKKAASALRALTQPRTKWDLLQGVARLDDERKPEADELLADVLQALQADEYNRALEPVLGDAESRAIRLLSPPKPPPGRVLVEAGTIEVDASNWEEVAAKLSAKLNGGDGGLKLTLRWSLEREAARR